MRIPTTLQPTRPGDTADPPPRPGSRNAALTAVCLGHFMILLDGSALNVALPAIGHDVHGSMAALQWVVNVYTIPLAAVVLTAGSLGDRLGARRLFLASLGGFTAASVACSLSPTPAALVAARFVQGVAAGGLLPTTLAIIARTHPDPVHRTRAITVWGATGGLALAAGPLGGGLLTDLAGWRAIFAVNVPVGLVTAALAARHVAETQRRPAVRADLPGQLAAVAALSAAVAWLIEGGPLGWSAPLPLALLAAAVGGSALFVVVELRSAHPMLPLAVFRRPAFTASVACGFAFQFGGYGLQFMLAVHLQQHWGLSALATGGCLVPFAAAWVFGTVVPARRMVALGPRTPMWTGSLTSCAGALLLLGVNGPASWPLFAVATVAVGLGCGVCSPSLNATALASIDPAWTGLGSGILNTARQIGTAVGVALLGSLLALPDVLSDLRLAVLAVASCFAAMTALTLRYVGRR